MTTTGLFHFDSSDYDAAAIKTAISMADGLARTITIARLLVENGRTVDMAGLDRGVGLLVRQGAGPAARRGPQACARR